MTCCLNRHLAALPAPLLLPSTPHVLLPSTPHVLLPSTPCVLLPSAPRVLLPSTPHVLLPSTPHVLLPSTPHVLLPSTPRVLLPRSPHVLLPSTPHVLPYVLAGCPAFRLMALRPPGPVRRLWWWRERRSRGHAGMRHRPTSCRVPHPWSPPGVGGPPPHSSLGPRRRVCQAWRRQPRPCCSDNSRWGGWRLCV